jgi:2-polyprenyl-3-methyl-5-hydroxy-6-metoxy-1,4-benzoquinol methylase
MMDITIDEPAVPNVHKLVQTILTNLDSAEKTILDIGGSNHRQFCNDNGYGYTSLDLKTPLKTGEGGHHTDSQTILYDGINIPSFQINHNIVLFMFILHHAKYPIALLRQVCENIKPQYIIIGEDISQLNYPQKWHERNLKHQPGGIFRSAEEWIEIMQLLGMSLHDRYNLFCTKRDSVFNTNSKTFFRSILIFNPIKVNNHVNIQR